MYRENLFLKDMGSQHINKELGEKIFLFMILETFQNLTEKNTAIYNALH